MILVAFSGIGVIGETIEEMGKLKILVGSSDVGKVQELTYGQNSSADSTNVLIEGGPGSGRQELIYNFMYYLVTNYSPKEVLVYDVCRGKEWTFTWKHYRNVRTSKSMEEFLEFIAKEIDDRKALTKNTLPNIFLFFDYINEYSLSLERPEESAKECVRLFRFLLEEGHKVGVYLISSCSWGDVDKIEDVKQKYNTIIRIPMKLFSKTGELETINGKQDTQRNTHFKFEKLYGKNFFKSLRRQLSFPVYQYHIIEKYLTNRKSKNTEVGA